VNGKMILCRGRPQRMTAWVKSEEILAPPKGCTIGGRVRESKRSPLMNKMARVSGYVILGCLLSVACVWLLYVLIGHSLIEAMYQGRSIGFLNRIIEGQAVHSLGHYLRAADAWLISYSVKPLKVILFVGLLSLSLLFSLRYRHTMWSNLPLSLISLALILLIGEIATRTYQMLFRGIPFHRPVVDFLDKELGWQGKKVFGDLATEKIKIFVIGDSFTGGWGPKEESMYYNVLAEGLNAEVFVYGGVGYGTLQEYLALDRYFDLIEPDLVLLQVTWNDFIDNSLKLASDV